MCTCSDPETINNHLEQQLAFIKDGCQSQIDENDDNPDILRLLPYNKWQPNKIKWYIKLYYTDYRVWENVRELLLDYKQYMIDQRDFKKLDKLVIYSNEQKETVINYVGNVDYELNLNIDYERYINSNCTII
jgi:hypothetical protein